MFFPRDFMEQCRLCPKTLWRNADFAPQNRGDFILCLAKSQSLHNLPCKIMEHCRLCPAKSINFLLFSSNRPAGRIRSSSRDVQPLCVVCCPLEPFFLAWGPMCRKSVIKSQPKIVFRIGQHCTALHYAALHCTALHYTALHCSALYCTARHCTALHCTALH